MNKKFNTSLILLACALSLTACEGTKKQLGLAKSSPDEFAVLTRAPLEMPPDYGLRPPRPGSPRPQEQETSAQAAQAVFGAESAEQEAPIAANGEEAILLQTGADAANPQIRDLIDRESVELQPEKPAAEKLLGIKFGSSKNPVETTIDPVAERERLRKQAADAPDTDTAE